MTPLDLAQAFLAKAEEDELLLSKLVNDSEVSDDIYGFHAQQAAEKFIKAVLAMEETRPTHTHDLTALLEQVAALGVDIPEGILDVRYLTPFAVRNRYPFMDPIAIDRAGALDLVRRVRSWAEEIVGSE